nr:hypothetical protein [Mesorhizobium atlanticum]
MKQHRPGLAKNVFQIHGADAEGAPIFNRKLRRAELLGFFEKLPRRSDQRSRHPQDHAFRSDQIG